MFSFHATKLYHSLEGGMLVFQDAGLKKTFDYLKNFGFENELEVVMPGTNAKMNEMQALMGSMMLQYVDELIGRRRRIAEVYRDRLKDVCGIQLVPNLPEEVSYTHAYMPVEIDKEEFGVDRDALCEELKQYNVYVRRYFYPLICDYACYRGLSVKDPLDIARRVSSRILTLPIYPELGLEDVHRICDILLHIRDKHCGTFAADRRKPSARPVSQRLMLSPTAITES